MGYLTGTAEAGKFDIAAALTRVMLQGGPGAYRQVWQIMKLRLFRTGLKMEEYYDFGLWRPREGPVLRRELVGALRFKDFNGALRMPGRGPGTDTVDDKLATEALLLAAGLPAVRTLAAFAPQGEVPAHVRRMPDAAAVAAFLADPANLPLFGKPRADSFARGAAAITGPGPGRRSVTMLSGTIAPADALAAEIAADYAAGYLFQPFLQTAEPLRSHTGPAMASLRIATLLTDRGVDPWYAVLRIPAKRAMHDGDARTQRVWGLVDLATGAITALRDLKDPVKPPLTHWLNRDTPLLGLVLPHWPAALQAAREAHLLFPGHGILGWDLFLTDDGPLISETNANPGPVYQAAAARGMRNPDMEPLYARALAFAKSVNARA